jgi:rod shape-determining protein MreC
VFPAGYPVAKVAEVHRDAVQPLAQVRATPFANIEGDREVVLVWFREDNPAAPMPATTPTGDLNSGNPKLKPQPAPPPRPKPAPAEAAPATPAATPSGAPTSVAPNATSKQPTQPAPSPDATPRNP